MVPLVRSPARGSTYVVIDQNRAPPNLHAELTSVAPWGFFLGLGVQAVPPGPCIKGSDNSE